MCCAEPYRVFFPLGILFGLSGVSLWPLYFSGLHKFYPGIMHARLMIEGFLGAFIVGFLGTAGPRLTGTAPLSRAELGWLLALLVGRYLNPLGMAVSMLISNTLSVAITQWVRNDVHPRFATAWATRRPRDARAGLRSCGP